jgi:hypothetical protein
VDVLSREVDYLLGLYGVVFLEQVELLCFSVFIFFFWCLLFHELVFKSIERVVVEQVLLQIALSSLFFRLLVVVVLEGDLFDVSFEEVGLVVLVGQLFLGGCF